MPGTNRACAPKLLLATEPEEIRLDGFECLGGAGLEVAVAKASELRDWLAPHEGQKLAPGSTAVPQAGQRLDETLATRGAPNRRHTIRSSATPLGVITRQLRAILISRAAARGTE